MSDAANTTERLANQIASTVTERARVYGAPEKNFGAIADLWNGWLSARHGIEVNLDATDVGMMSALIKVARLAQTPGHEDSALDAATYLLLGHGCVSSASEPASEGGAPVVKESDLREMAEDYAFWPKSAAPRPVQLIMANAPSGEPVTMTVQQYVDRFGLQAAVDAGLVEDNG